MIRTEQVFLFFVFGVFVATLPTVTAQGGNGDYFLYNPCWLKPCHSYARCQIINGSQAVCVCPNQCPNLNRPVCGTDWKTYANMCELMTKTCKSNEWTQLRYYGACKSGDCSQTRWHQLRCPYYSQCRLNYGLPSCACPEKHCPSDYRPVCGTDGKTYTNVCILKRASCKQKKWLLVRNLGHCRPDPCHTIDCCCGARCRVNNTNQATCKCNFACSQHFHPVCGSDGKTYSNACNLRSAACAQQNQKLSIVKSGACPKVKPTPSPCATVKCGYYSTCEVIKNEAKCVCPSLCINVSEPVCGSDGKTYGNVCALKLTSCDDQRSISVDKKGVCIAPTTPTPTVNPCTIGKCAHYAKCKVIKREAKCICPNLCLEVSKPVCGSDGKTYKNECHLKRTSCKDQRSISIVKKGVCESPCNLIDCCCGATCKVVNNRTICECSLVCTEQHDPVCGSDGRTYSNNCKLRLQACQKGDVKLKEVSKGPCVHTPTKQTPTINPCAVGKCGYHATCMVVENEAKCVCPSLCPSVSNPVCGSDDHTYENECSLRRASCKDQIRVSVVSQGICERPTSCPRPKTCLNLCNKDECATRGQICCCKGCTFNCTTPIKRFGRNICPLDPLTCRSDRDCSNGDRCCPDGCTRRCVAV